MSAYYEFKLPTKILSGDGALEHIPHELEGLGGQPPPPPQRPGAGAGGHRENRPGGPPPRGHGPGGDLLPHPPDSSIEVVNQVAALFRGKGCDSLIALGGGSVIDTAKGVGMVLAQAGGRPAGRRRVRGALPRGPTSPCGHPHHRRDRQ